MTAQTRKVVHAVGIALVGALTDAGLQLGSGTFNPTRTVIAGLLIGGLARLLGAYLSATAADPPTNTGPGNG